MLAKDFKIASNPSEAELFAVSPADGTKTKLGKTPFKRPLSDLLDNYVKGNIFLLEISKEGYETYRMLVTKTSNVEIDLKVNLTLKNDIKKIKLKDKMIDDLFTAQRLIRSRNFTGAITLLDKLEDKFKKYSVISELKGTTYYLMGNLEKALAEYRLAFSKNTDNVDAYKMKTYLEKKMGVEAK